MAQNAQRIEFRSTYDANDGSGRTGVDTASNNLMPNMTDKAVNDIFEKLAAARSSDDMLHPVQIGDDALAARVRVVNFTAQTLSSGVLKVNSTEGQILRAAIEHQLNAGGAKAADSLAGDISAGLPNGMKLEIKENKDFEKNVKDFFEKKNEPVPTYIRWIELKDKDGKVLGAVGITGDANANEKKK